MEKKLKFVTTCKEFQGHQYDYWSEFTASRFYDSAKQYVAIYNSSFASYAIHECI